MTSAKTFAILLLAVLCTGAPTVAATVTYTSLPYRGRSDSPFFQSIQNGTTYVEDFEDRLANTPGLSMSTGRTFDSLGQSVDEDEGVLNHLGQGRAWVVPNTPLVPEGVPFSVRASFARDSFGNYPTHAGAVILGFSRVDFGDFRYFQAYDANGTGIPGSALSALIPVLPNITSQVSTAGDRFFGLIHEGGISSIVLGSSLYFDHVQYGYGPIPEPAAGTLLAGGLLLLSGRRRRSLL
jgi:hypothetical protein